MYKKWDFWSFGSFISVLIKKKKQKKPVSVGRFSFTFLGLQFFSETNRRFEKTRLIKKQLFFIRLFLIKGVGNSLVALRGL